MRTSYRRFAVVVMGLVVLLGAGDAALAQPRVLDLEMKNTSSYPMWVTIYEGLAPRKIVQTLCMPPGKIEKLRRTQASATYLRAEVTQNANCQHPVLCDTTVTVDAKSRPGAWEYKADLVHTPQNRHCHWQPR